MALPPAFTHEAPRQITAEEKEFSAFKTLRQARGVARYEGQRKAKAAKRDEEEAAKKK